MDNENVLWTILKRVFVVIVGIFISVSLFSVFVEFSIHFTAVGSIYRESGNTFDIGYFDTLSKMIWRFEYFYNPVTVIAVSLFVVISEQTRAKWIMAVAANLPFIALYLASDGFNLHGFAFGMGYLFLIVLILSIIPNRKNFRKIKKVNPLDFDQ